MAKHSKNLQKVQDMLDGKGSGKIQVGYSTAEEIHKVGDIWTDSDDKTWEQKDGYRTNVTKLANAGIAEQCSDCNKYIVTHMEQLDGNNYLVDDNNLVYSFDVNNPEFLGVKDNNSLKKIDVPLNDIAAY